MALSALRPTLLRGAVLNDIGPVIDGKGLVRIRSYVGKLPAPRNFAEGAEMLRRMSDAQFPRFTEEQWQRMARGTWRDDGGKLASNYDPRLMKTLESIDLEMPLPVLWPLFEGLKNAPVLVLRGSNSDILSANTLDQMRRTHPHLDAITVPDQGHAPSIDGDLAVAYPQIRRDGRNRPGHLSLSRSPILARSPPSARRGGSGPPRSIRKAP